MTDPTCSVPGCGRRIRARGWCATHWDRWNKHGDVQAHIPVRSLRPRGMDIADIFTHFMPDQPPKQGCWVWTGAINPATGYGRMWHGDRSRSVHRFAYERFKGPIPDGLFVCHRCDNPPCCHPDHLFLGTPADNTRDMMSKDRHVRGIVYGESCGTHKLSERDVLDIRRRYAERSSTQVELSAEYGISKNHTCAIIKRHAWQHLP